VESQGTGGDEVDTRSALTMSYYSHIPNCRGTQRFISGNICSGDLNRLRNSDLIPVKTRDFFGETSPQTFVRRGAINSFCSLKDRYVIQGVK